MCRHHQSLSGTHYIPLLQCRMWVHSLQIIAHCGCNGNIDTLIVTQKHYTGLEMLSIVGATRAEDIPGWPQCQCSAHH